MKLIKLILIALPLTLSACASINDKRESFVINGVIQNIRYFQQTEKQPSVFNTVAGGAIGGVVGNQFGKGNGKTALTVLGAVGGALAGSQVGQKSVNVNMQELFVGMPNGNILPIAIKDNGESFYVGQKVTINVKGKTAEVIGN